MFIYTNTDLNLAQKKGTKQEISQKPSTFLQNTRGVQPHLLTVPNFPQPPGASQGLVFVHWAGNSHSTTKKTSTKHQNIPILRCREQHF